MRKADLLICPVLLLFCAPTFAQESPRGGNAKQDAPKVIATKDMKLAMKASKLETAGKYDEALKVYAQAIVTFEPAPVLVKWLDSTGKEIWSFEHSKPAP